MLPSQQSINGDGEDDVTSYPLVDDFFPNWSAIDSKGARVECIWDFSPKEDETG